MDNRDVNELYRQAVQLEFKMAYKKVDRKIKKEKREDDNDENLRTEETEFVGL